MGLFSFTLYCKSMKRFWPIVAASAVFVIDRLLKLSVRDGLETSFGPFEIAHYRNDGLIFSLPVPYWLAVGLMLVAAILITTVIWRQRRYFGDRWPVVLLLVGALSNVYDRIAYGYIVDYVYLSPHWPIFNLADSALTIGMLWLLWRAVVDKQHRPSPQ